MKTVLVLALTLLALQPAARAEDGNAFLDLIQITSGSCISEEFAGCVESGRFEEECVGKQSCVIKKCRQWAKDTCDTI